MQLTGKQIVENKIIYGNEEAGVQQQGIDVRVKYISKVEAKPGLFSSNDGTGLIPLVGKTVTPRTSCHCPTYDKERDVNYWYLPVGYYEVEFYEGCKIPANCAMYFKTRSSLVRCGAEVRSGQFDGGFETESMGAFLKVDLPIRIDVGARIAQAIVTETYPVDEENLYDGQWQNDQQRN